MHACGLQSELFGEASVPTKSITESRERGETSASSEMDECVEMLVVETARRASRIITSGDKRGTLLARRGCRQCEEVLKSERES